MAVPKGLLAGSKNPRWRLDALIRNCRTCGKEIRILRSRAKQNKGFYCSKACYGKATSLRQRGKPLPWTKYTGKPQFCDNCATLVYRGGYYAKRRNKHVFCSKVCEGEWRRGPRNSFYGKTHSKDTIAIILSKSQRKPNRAEKKLQKIFDQNNLPFRFVGDGSLIIDGMNPDYVSKVDPKQLIELFGEFWHKEQRVRPRLTQSGRILAYENLGYKCLVVWYEELKHQETIVSKVRAFMAQEVVIKG